MIPEDRSGFEKYLGKLNKRAISGIARSFGQPPDAPIRALARVLAPYYTSAGELRSIASRLAPEQRLALRLALDAGRRGIASDLLVLLLSRRGAGEAHQLVQGLITAGLLLPVTEEDPYHTSSSAAFGGRYIHGWMLAVPPALAPALETVEVPGEARTWAGPVERADPPQGRIQRQCPLAVAAALGAVVKVVERYKQPLTSRLNTPKNVQRFLKKLDLSALVPDELVRWIALCTSLDLIDAAGGLRFRPLPRGVRLATDPLSVLLDIGPAMIKEHEEAVQEWEVRAQGRQGYEYAEHFGWYGHPWLDNRLALATIKALREAARAGLDSDTWFAEAELRPALEREMRLWFSCVHGTNPWSFHHINGYHINGASLDRMLGANLVAMLSMLCATGLLERAGTDAGDGRGRQELIRLTPLGRASLAGDRDALAPWRAQLGWSAPDRLRLPDDGRAREMVLAALGPLAPPQKGARRTPPQRVAIDRPALDRALAAGMPPEEQAAGLRRIVTGEPLPAALAASLQEMAERHRPALLCEGLSALELPSATAEDEQRLAGMGLVPLAGLWLGEADRVNRAARELGVRRPHRFDYELPPDRACHFTKRMEIEIPSDVRGDLRLRRVLEPLGVDPNAAGPQRLGFEARHGESDSATLRRLRSALNRLRRHCPEQCLPDPLLVSLMGRAGLLDPPEVEEPLLLLFEERVAAALSALGGLGAGTRRLDRRRFLVAREHLADVERLLAEHGIPFPAAHSSLRERLRGRARVEGLRRAVEQLGGEARAGAAAGADRAPSGAAPAASAAAPGTADEEARAAALRLLAAAEGNDRPGLLLGAVAEGLGLDKRSAKRLLRRLVREGGVKLRGHARGARYRVSPG